MKKILLSKVNGKEIHRHNGISFNFVPILQNKKGKYAAFLLNPLHGRTLFFKKHKMKINNHMFNYLFIKGTGWTKQFNTFLLDSRDIPYMIGLLEEKDAIREWDISNYYLKYNFWTGIVLSVIKLEYVLDINGKLIKSDLITDLKGNKFNPHLIYFATRSKYRVCDLAFLSDIHKNNELEKVKIFFNVKSDIEYLKKFIEKLAFNVAYHHKLQGVNDSLSSHNVTLLGEIIDFEIIYSKEVPFDKKRWNLNLFKRQNREIFYALDLVTELIEYFKMKADWNYAKNLFLKYYLKHYSPHNKLSFFKKLGN